LPNKAPTRVCHTNRENSSGTPALSAVATTPSHDPPVSSTIRDHVMLDCVNAKAKVAKIRNHRCGSLYARLLSLGSK
jgi:hypothetical protein